MATQRLIIDGIAPGQFLLRVDGETVTIGDGDAARMLGSLRVERIRCVLDIDSDGITVGGDADDQRAIRPGEVIESEGCRVRLEGAAGAAASKPAPRLKKRLLAIAGPDEGRDFPLPADGIITLGRDRNQVDIVLRGLRVERVHCHLKIDGDNVEAMDEGKLGTQINGRRFARQELKPGDILKIDGNQLRLEVVGPGEEFPVAVPKHQAAPVAAAEEEAEEQEPVEPPPASAPESARLLFEWRQKLAQLSGQTIGHYKLGPVLGCGRVGVVFRAEDENGGQTLALELLSPQFPANNLELQRFASVVKPLLPLRHDHVVALVAAGKNPPYTWLAGEFVEGEDLCRVIRRQQRDEEYDPALASRVALHVARALVFARQHRLRHGALTPAHILIRKSDQVVKLAGLMLDAALAGSEVAEAVQAYRTPAEVAYLSPEQATPGAFVDESSDLYALGAVLYALLTGRPPFLGKTAGEVLAQIRDTARVERPTTLNRGVPAALERVVMKLLAKHSEDRYATPAELLSDLEPIVAALGVSG